MLTTASGTQRSKASDDARGTHELSKLRNLYVPSLDGLRFFAFLAVFIHHSTVTGLPGLDVVKRIGWFGVELFFVISAYLFLHLLRAEQRKTGTINKRQFFARRLLRLYPAMIAYSAVMLLLVYDFPGFLDFLSIATFTKNIQAAIYGYDSALPFTAHLWTLAFEFQVYLAIPGLFLVWHRYGTRGLLITAALIWIVALVLRSGAIAADLQHPTVWVLPITRPDSVIAGLLLAALTVQPNPS